MAAKSRSSFAMLGNAGSVGSAGKSNSSSAASLRGLGVAGSLGKEMLREEGKGREMCSVDASRSQSAARDCERAANAAVGERSADADGKGNAAVGEGSRRANLRKSSLRLSMLA